MSTLIVGQEDKDFSWVCQPKGDSYFFGAGGRDDSLSSHVTSSFGRYEVRGLISNAASSLSSSKMARYYDDLVIHAAFALNDLCRRPSLESRSVKVSADKDALNVYREYLGDHCADRLSVFLSLKENWDGDGAEELSYISLVQSLKFIKVAALSKDVAEGASVFMDCDGCVSISLPIKDEGMLEIFFLQNEISVYSDADDAEETFEGVCEDLVAHIMKYF